MKEEQKLHTDPSEAGLSGERRVQGEEPTPFSSTPYDDVFQTLLRDHPFLVLPLLNEMFGEKYTGEEQILHRPTMFYLNRGKGEQPRRISDSSFTVVSGGEARRARHYHLECESAKPRDYRILIRIFEYDAQIALDQGSSISGNRLTVRFPHTGILFLRSRKTARGSMTVTIRTPGGNVSYEVPVLKIRDYTLDELFEKNLLLLLPFYIFIYDGSLGEIEGSTERREALQREFAAIRSRLEGLQASGKLDLYAMHALLEMTAKIVRHLAVKHANIVKGVNKIMGGEVIDYEAKRLVNKGIAIGQEMGEEAGRDLRLIEQIQKKVRKGKELSIISDELEQAESAIQPFYEAILKAGTDCSSQKILAQVRSQAQQKPEALRGSL